MSSREILRGEDGFFRFLSELHPHDSLRLLVLDSVRMRNMTGSRTLPVAERSHIIGDIVMIKR